MDAEEPKEDSLAVYLHNQQPLASLEDFKDLSKSGDYLCRIQLCGSNSTLVKKDKIQKKHYAYIVSKDDFVDLGESVDILPLIWRPKAVDMSGDVPVSFYNKDTPEFLAIAEKSRTQDSECSYGPDFLVWLPHPKVMSFATLLFGSKSARKEAPKLFDLLGKGATLTSKVIDNSKYIWEAIVVNPCSTPFALPDQKALDKAMTRFKTEMNTPGPEKADATPERER